MKYGMNATGSDFYMVLLPAVDLFPRSEVKLPGRCTMQELLEYSRRNTAVQGGKLGHPSDFPSFDRRIWHDYQGMARCKLHIQ